MPVILKHDNLQMSVITAAFGEVAGAGQLPYKRFDGIEPIGLFRVRRRMEISEFMHRIADALIDDNEDIEIDGVTIHRPQLINIRMTGFRQWAMTPPMPISVKVLDIDISVDVSAIELVRDTETESPALFVTTASGMKPDLLIVFEVGHTDALGEPSPSSEEVVQAIMRHSVPAQHRLPIMKAVSYAWGPSQIAPIRMKAITGDISKDSAEKAAKAIVTELVQQQVVQGGLFFWMRLGYWLVRIITALIQSRRS